MWLSSALLLLCLEGCLSLMGPGYVTGTVGGSLCVQCQYEQSYKNSKKYWCRGQFDTQCDIIVEALGGKKGRSDRVSITDHTDDLTMTVTMEDLSEDDAGSYWCKIQTFWILDAWSRDPSVKVQVYVYPATTPMVTTLPAMTLPPVTSGQNSSISTNSLLSSFHFQVLVFLKLPLFLSMLCAVFWVNTL
uniref:CMRF35-like molecule 2 n=1 Tax=Jaculus jaculus TaxID=51337 RepID=UPI001E1B5A31|nr:CMRF35-like molecule 2 [Jaculus jaculus]